MKMRRLQPPGPGTWLYQPEPGYMHGQTQPEALVRVLFIEEATTPET